MQTLWNFKESVSSFGVTYFSLTKEGAIVCIRMNHAFYYKGQCSINNSGYPVEKIAPDKGGLKNYSIDRNYEF